MLDYQKISFDDFIFGYKHGVYVFTKDSCLECQRAKSHYADIEDYNFYFVEVVTTKQEALVEKIINRSSYPIIAGFADNVLQFARVGLLYSSQLDELVWPLLKKLGSRRLSDEEIETRIKKLRNRCLLTYYVFPPNVTTELKQKIVNNAYRYNELPIVINDFATGAPDDERERMLEGQYASANLVIFTNGNNLANFEQRIVMGYAAVNQEIKFTMREVSEYD